jgi:hypothetical protein
MHIITYKFLKAPVERIIKAEIILSKVRDCRLEGLKNFILSLLIVYSSFVKLGKTLVESLILIHRN